MFRYLKRLLKGAFSIFCTLMGLAALTFLLAVCCGSTLLWQ